MLVDGRNKPTQYQSKDMHAHRTSRTHWSIKTEARRRAHALERLSSAFLLRQRTKSCKDTKQILLTPVNTGVKEGPFKKTLPSFGAAQWSIASISIGAAPGRHQPRPRQIKAFRASLRRNAASRNDRTP